MVEALLQFIAWIPGGIWLLIGTIISGVALKFSESWFNREGGKRAERAEARMELKELNDRIDKLEEEIDLWRKRYYAEQEESASLRLFIIQHCEIPPPARTAPVP